MATRFLGQLGKRVIRSKANSKAITLQHSNPKLEWPSSLSAEHVQATKLSKFEWPSLLSPGHVQAEKPGQLTETNQQSARATLLRYKSSISAFKTKTEQRGAQAGRAIGIVFLCLAIPYVLLNTRRVPGTGRLRFMPRNAPFLDKLIELIERIERIRRITIRGTASGLPASTVFLPDDDDLVVLARATLGKLLQVLPEYYAKAGFANEEIRNDIQWQVYVMESFEGQCCSTEKGAIGIDVAMLANCVNEDRLASLLGHEVSAGSGQPHHTLWLIYNFIITNTKMSHVILHTVSDVSIWIDFIEGYTDISSLPFFSFSIAKNLTLHLLRFLEC